jgi:glycerol-3-phosphate acyltransferase PlsX
LTEEKALVRIAVDAMGGDNAPGEIVKGAVEFAKSGEAQILLVGDPELVGAELAKHDASSLPIAVIPSKGVIKEGDAPALALRQNPRASILVSTGLVKKGQADASVTMGSTGGAMAAAAVILGLAKGIERPALGGPIIGMAPRTVILDLGTNVDCRPQQLVSFAVIGDVFAKHFWNVENPRVALLSVGAESGKGNRQVRETTELLEKSGLNFVGNVEAHDLLTNSVEVAVCDGFVGNIVMKLTEGIGRATADLVRSRLEGKLGGEDIDELANEIYELCNQVETRGGGPLFGVNGVSVVGHGAGRADAVKRAIEMAKLAVDTGFVSQMYQDLESVHARLEE